jgi:hypothetical protein
MDATLGFPQEKNIRLKASERTVLTIFGPKRKEVVDNAASQNDIPL